MKKFKQILYSCLLLISQISICQVNEFDSLYGIWQDSTNTEEKRLDAFYKTFNHLEKTESGEEQMEKWYNSIDEAIHLAEKYNKKNYIPWFLLIKAGYTDDVLKNQSKACLIYAKAVEKAIHFNDYQNSFLLIPNILRREQCSEVIKISEKKLITEFINSSEKLNQKLKEGSLPSHPLLSVENNYGQQDFLMLAYSILGSSYKNRSQYPEALKYYQKGLAYAKEYNLSDFLETIQRYMGVIHTDIGNYDEAEKYLLQALNLALKKDDLRERGGIYNDLSRLYLNSNQPDKALKAVNKAIAIMEPKMNTDGACYLCVHESYTAEAGVYNLLGNYNTALKKLLRIKDHFDDPYMGSGPYGYAFYFAELATAYFGLKDYQNAIDAADKSLSYTEGRTLNEARRSQNIIYKSQKALGNYKESMDALERYVTIKDSMAVLRNAQEVTRLELENTFQQEQLKKEIAFQAELNKQKATRNIIFVIGFVVLLVALGLFYRLYLIRKTQKALQQKNNIIRAEKEKAQASERAKQQFLANMSHEIRTPMNAIKGMTDILIRRQPKNDQKDYLEAIKQSVNSLLVIIDDILDISKIEAGKIKLEKETFSVNELVDKVYTIMQFKAEEKGLELKKNFPDQPIIVKGDASRLRQILINLIGNAIKFTEKGVVTTIIKPEQTEGKLNLHFTVSDTGIGIDRKRLERIFNSFEQAHNNTNKKFGGTGLGLSISKNLVELQGGEIWAESENGKGSQLHFTIPYKKVNPQVNMEEPTADMNNASSHLKGISILLAEDNHFNAVVAREELEDAIENVKVEVAENGCIVLEKLKSSHFDIILMDVQMPKMNGYEATQAIRNLKNGKSQTPIIAMTANVLQEEVDLCFQAGMDAFIGKPFNIDVLLQKMSHLNTKSHES